MRDVENALVDLFDYENFELVKTLTRNREKIVWCTKLARSDDKERMDVEVTMREKGVGWILKELSATTTSTTADGASASRTGAIKAEDGMMDIDSSSAAPAIPKTNIAPGSLVQPKGTVDLESMIFSQGSRLMSNKKCKLPEGSFKRSKKGYEEIHVPPPKKGEVKQGELVPIADLPEWTRVAFKGARELNRVQSRLYPVAFGDDDPILLCAPTGAGKVSIRYPCR
jgi:pre-mRNA-splicing helicase BRR2